ncbi:hypothetical protein F2Q70_00043373 [Brassica cretica]|uniref:Retrotransposon gag domain-containing protein n=1 Tax=Brassica cretica TaxID=69181 RepID=A0A8S9KCF8_BRACR|nr:hypothetical protein F2Q70_00043373 [Brassica cretica]
MYVGVTVVLRGVAISLEDILHIATSCSYGASTLCSCLSGLWVGGVLKCQCLYFLQNMGGDDRPWILPTFSHELHRRIRCLGMDGDLITVRWSPSFDIRYSFELAFQCDRIEVNHHPVAEVIPVLLKSGQSVSQEKTVEEIKDCRSMTQHWYIHMSTRSNKGIGLLLVEPLDLERVIHKSKRVDTLQAAIGSVQIQMSIDTAHLTLIDTDHLTSIDIVHPTSIDTAHQPSIDTVYSPSTDTVHQPSDTTCLEAREGLPHEDPRDLIKELEELASASEHNEISVDHIICKIFPYSLFGDAFSWFSQLQPRSLTCWEDIKTAFLDKFLYEATATREKEKNDKWDRTSTSTDGTTSTSTDITTSTSIDITTSTSIDVTTSSSIDDVDREVTMEDSLVLEE